MGEFLAHDKQWDYGQTSVDTSNDLELKLLKSLAGFKKNLNLKESWSAAYCCESQIVDLYILSQRKGGSRHLTMPLTSVTDEVTSLFESGFPPPSELRSIGYFPLTIANDFGTQVLNAYFTYAQKQDR